MSKESGHRVRKTVKQVEQVGLVAAVAVTWRVAVSDVLNIIMIIIYKQGLFLEVGSDHEAEQDTSWNNHRVES